MNEKISLDSKYLVEIRLGENHEKVHAAWQDDTNEGFLICYDINLLFDDQTIFLVKPCEIGIAGRYPGMALSLEKIESVNCQSPFNASCLPMKVDEVIQTDYLGEGAVNEIILVLVNKCRIIIRHVFPPMTMGVKLEQKMPNKPLKFVPATKSVASTGLPTLRCGSQLARRYVGALSNEHG